MNASIGVGCGWTVSCALATMAMPPEKDPLSDCIHGLRMACHQFLFSLFVDNACCVLGMVCLDHTEHVQILKAFKHLVNPGVAFYDC